MTRQEFFQILCDKANDHTNPLCHRYTKLIKSAYNKYFECHGATWTVKELSEVNIYNGYGMNEEKTLEYILSRLTQEDVAKILATGTDKELNEFARAIKSQPSLFALLSTENASHIISKHDEKDQRVTLDVLPFIVEDMEKVFDITWKEHFMGRDAFYADVLADIFGDKIIKIFVSTIDSKNNYWKLGGYSSAFCEKVLMYPEASVAFVAALKNLTVPAIERLVRANPKLLTLLQSGHLEKDLNPNKVWDNNSVSTEFKVAMYAILYRNTPLDKIPTYIRPRLKKYMGLFALYPDNLLAISTALFTGGADALTPVKKDPAKKPVDNRKWVYLGVVDATQKVFHTKEAAEEANAMAITKIELSV